MDTSHTLKINMEMINQLRNALVQNKLVTELASKNPYEAFRFRCGSDIIVIYTNGKIVSTGEESRQVLYDTLLGLERKDGLSIVVGSDEAGKGEWLGPMIVAAVALDQAASIRLMAEGIMDSKLLNLSRIRELALIVRKNSLSYRTVTIAPARFNELVVEVKDEGKSLNDLLAWAHTIAVKNVINKLGNMQRSIRIVIDEFDKLKMKSRLERAIDLNRYQLSQYPKAEEEIAVAAASILARDEREYWVDVESRRRGIDLRSLRIDEVLSRNDASQFAKVSYLKIGSSERDITISKFLQNVIMLEHMLWQIVTGFGIRMGESSLKGMPDELGKRGLVTESMVNHFNEVLNLRNRLAHGEVVSDKEITEVMDLSIYLVEILRRLVMEMKRNKSQLIKG